MNKKDKLIIECPVGINHLFTHEFINDIILPTYNDGIEKVYCRLKKPKALYIYHVESIRYFNYKPSEDVIEIEVGAIQFILRKRRRNLVEIDTIIFYKKFHYNDFQPDLIIKPRYMVYGGSIKSQYLPIRYFLFDENKLSLYEKIKNHKNKVFNNVNEELYNPDFDGKSNPDIIAFKNDLDCSLWNLRIRPNEKEEVLIYGYYS